MKQLLIFSTQVKSGKGGISTALVGYIEEFERNKINYSVITTHSENSRAIDFLSSLKYCFKISRGDVCWFHAGPWFSILRKLLLALICKLKGGEVVFHFHSPKTVDYLNSPVSLLLIKLIVIISDRIVLLTPWWLDVFVKYFGDQIDKFLISNNPIDAQLESFASKTLENKIPDNSNRNEKNDRIPPNSVVKILAMARLEKGKGVDKVIESLQFLPENFELIVAGTGSQESYLKSLVEKLDLSSRVVFRGWVDYSVKSDLFNCVDIFCLPSKLDSFGMVYLEAMAFNLPIVALDYQAIPDVVSESCGILIEPNYHSPQLAEAIQKASQMKVYSSKYLLDHFTSRKIAKNFLKGIKYYD